MTATPDQVLSGVASFLQAVIPEITKVYDYVPAFKDADLPDVVVQLEGSYLTMDSPDFPFYQLQQRELLIFNIGCSIMVDNGDPEKAAETLRDYQDRITTEAVKSATLGSRVPIRSPRFSFGYTPPLAEYEDGTIGREITWQLAVADLITVED